MAKILGVSRDQIKRNIKKLNVLWNFNTQFFIKKLQLLQTIRPVLNI